MIRSGIDLQLQIHRVTELRLRQHAADRVFDKTLRLAWATDTRARLPQAALVPLVLPVNLLIYLAARELYFRGLDDDDVIASVEKRHVYRLVLALQQAGSRGRKATEHDAVR